MSTSRTIVAGLMLLLAGFVAGRRWPPPPPVPPPVPPSAPRPEASICETRLQATKDQLVACASMRAEVQPTGDNQDDKECAGHLAACRLSLSDKTRKRTIERCYAFLDAVPFYEHVFKYSAEEEAPRRHRSVEECLPVARWAKAASSGREACLDAVADGEGAEELAGKTFTDFEALPIVKACAHRRDVTDAMFEQDAMRKGRREVIRTTDGGGVRMYPIDSAPPPSRDSEPHLGAAGF